MYQLGWAGQEEVNFIFPTLKSERSSLTSASLLHFLVDCLISLAVTLVFKKRGEKVVSRLF